MRIIFLDIDGVFVTQTSLALHGHGLAFDRSCIDCFNRLLTEAPSKIAISSTWRETHALESLRERFRSQGFRYSDSIVGTTPILHRDRGLEIIEWLNTNFSHHESVASDYLVIDDNMHDIHPHIDPRRCIQTETDEGFQEEHLAMALAIPGFASPRQASGRMD